MNAEQLRDFLAEYIDYYFPDSHIYIGLNGRLYEIGQINSHHSRVTLVPGEESELSIRVREEFEMDNDPRHCPRELWKSTCNPVSLCKSNIYEDLAVLSNSL